jgi:Transglutaminase-like superfamily
MVHLGWAQFLVAFVPFNRWSGSLGQPSEVDPADRLDEARRDAADVEWAAKRWPVLTKCLPRAMALSWTLRRKRIRHAVVIAVRPMQQRQSADALHAWVEVDGARILGDLPGRWIETARLD